MKIARVVSAVLAVALLTLVPGGALAQAAFVTAQTRIYAEPDVSSRSLAVSAGTRVEVVGVKDGWALVERGGVRAYMDASKLVKAKMFDGKRVYAKRDLTLYAGPDTDAKRVAAVSQGEGLKLYAAVGDWACVTYGSKKGFTQGDGLTAEAPPAETPGDTEAPETTSAPTKTVTGYARRDGTKVYAAPSTSAAVVATLSLNDTVEVSGVRNGWCRVVRNSDEAYVRKSDLAVAPVTVTPEPTQAPTAAPEPTATPTPKTRTAYVKTDGARVYASYSTSSDVVTTLSRNDTVAVSAVKNGWCRVLNGSSVAYMRQADLSPSPVEEEEKTYIAYTQNDGVKVYQKCAKNARVLTKLPVNYEVTVLAVNGGWARVRNGGAVGYMQRGDLGSEKVADTPTPTPTPEATSVPEARVTGYVRTAGAKVYAAPATSAEVLATLAINDTVGMSNARDGWAQVINGSSVGYMRLEDLSGEKLTLLTVYVKTAGAKVYAAPATSADTLATLAVNDTVSISDKSGDWCRAINGNSVGYMRIDDLSPSKVETAEQTLKYGDTGEAVSKVQARLKELGFFAGTVGGNYMSLTRSAVEAFQSAAKLNVTGIVDITTLKAMFDDNAPKNKGSENPGSSAGYSSASPAHGTAVEMDWWNSDIQRIFARGTTAKVTDVATGISWYEKRTGGTNHADVQPASAADTNSMKKAVGSWSWTRRAIFVTINGVNYAASMNCMPHGRGSITNNNFNGHHCIHFTNSRTHGSNRVCSLHQNAIKRAARATL